MYRLFLTFLVTWTFVVVRAQENVTCFDKKAYEKNLSLTLLDGPWQQIRGTVDLPCHDSNNPLVIDTKKSTIKFPAERNKTETENSFTHENGVLTITITKGNSDGTDKIVKAVVFPEKLDYNSSFILYSCETVNKTEKVTARYLSKTKEVKLEDAKKVVDGIKDLSELKWNWTKQYCSGASMVHMSYIISIFAALFVSKM